MSDPITCPECEGRGATRVGPLRLRCQFCGGEGTVGGDRTRPGGWKVPEEDETHDPDVHGPLPPAADHPAVRGSGLCPMCLGAGVVVASGTYVEAPCPRCQRS